MAEKPLISVIVPVKDAEKYLNECIESLVDQTLFGSTEVIFINDGSKDKSGIILDKAAETYDNFKVIHTLNSGVSSARNTGLDNAKGKYISFIDADDMIEPDFYELLIRNFKGSTDAVGCGFTAEYPDKSVKHTCKRKTVISGRDIIKEFLKENILSPIVTDKLFLRNKIGYLRFDTTLSIGEDRLFLYNYLMRSEQIIILPDGKYHYRMHNESACRCTFNDKRLDSVRVCEKLTDSIRNDICELLPEAECSEIDMKCRIYGELYSYGMTEKYKEHYKNLKHEIRKFSLIKKMKYSGKKHTFALAAAKISPKLYVFLKYGLNLQYH